LYLHQLTIILNDINDTR